MLKFYIDNENNRDHLMWLSLSGNECKLAESFGDSMEFEFEDIEFLNEIHETTEITQEVLDLAIDWIKLMGKYKIYK